MRSNFEALAREHSDCGSAKKGGDLGLFKRGRCGVPGEVAAVCHPTWELIGFHGMVWDDSKLGSRVEWTLVEWQDAESL